MRTGDLQHAWVKVMLQQRGLPVKHDALLDHGRLMHHLIHSTMKAPSGAMMDQDYAHMLSTVGGPDEGNMVPQMQSMVSCQKNSDEHTVLPSAPTCSTNATCFDAENQIYASMLHWNDDEMYQPDAEPAWSCDVVDNNKHEPTAPPWDDEADSQVPLHDDINVQLTPIHCVVTPPAHTTPNAITALAIVGAVFIVMMTCIVLMLCWLASQGIQITGFWLTLTPSEWKPRDDDNALQ